MFDHDLVHAIFLKWEIDRRMKSAEYTIPTGTPQEVAQEYTDHFFKTAAAMGVLHD